MKEAFIEKKFRGPSLLMIRTVNVILEEYRDQGFRLSLRQLYYQLVARDIIANSTRSYKNLGTLVSNARQAGEVDWAMIEDRGRDTFALAHWSSPTEIIQSAVSSFRVDRWKSQPWYIECMVEKDALSGVLVPVCNRLDIPITANKGYSSSSTMYEIGKRLLKKSEAGKRICVIYLGDHDPSGIDMTRDIGDRLSMYSSLPKSEIDVQRVALNYDQVLTWRPPVNPAKETDARYEAYKMAYGKHCWELDAVEPAILSKLVEDTVLERRDQGRWDNAIYAEDRMKRDLSAISELYKRFKEKKK